LILSPVVLYSLSCTAACRVQEPAGRVAGVRAAYLLRLGLRNLGPVHDPLPGAVGLAARHLHPYAAVVGRAG
jgi:hypothetical protein